MIFIMFFKAAMKYLEDIGLQLKKLRKESGYTSYASFAWDNNINRTQYWRMEKGQNVTIKSLLVVLNIHGLTLINFFQMVEDNRSIST